MCLGGEELTGIKCVYKYMYAFFFNLRSGLKRASFIEIRILYLDGGSGTL